VRPIPLGSQSEVVRYPAVEGAADRTREHRVVARLPIPFLVGKGRIGIEQIVDSDQQFQGRNGPEGHVALPDRIVADRDEVARGVGGEIVVVLDKVVVQADAPVLIGPIECQLVLPTDDRLIPLVELSDQVELGPFSYSCSL
jgi:hypothetical protein